MLTFSLRLFLHLVIHIFFFPAMSLTNASVVSISSDPGLGRPAADHGGQRLGAGGLEGQRFRFEGLLAHLGGAAELRRGSALVFAA